MHLNKEDLILSSNILCNRKSLVSSVHLASTRTHTIEWVLRATQLNNEGTNEGDLPAHSEHWAIVPRSMKVISQLIQYIGQ